MTGDVEASAGVGRVEVGMVHGRFQPFHNGHLEYLLGAAHRSRQLIVGLTNTDPTHIRREADAPHRDAADANPFPYHVRYRMVRDTAASVGLDLRRLAIVPFPIHQPELWDHYVPREVVHFIRIFSPWEETKRARLAAAGWRVEVLDPGVPKRVSGAEVRRLLRQGGAWQALVPAEVAAVIAGLAPDVLAAAPRAPGASSSRGRRSNDRGSS